MSSIGWWHLPLKPVHCFLGLFASIVMRGWNSIQTALVELGPVVIAVNNLRHVPSIMTLFAWPTDKDRCAFTYRNRLSLQLLQNYWFEKK